MANGSNPPHIAKGARRAPGSRKNRAATPSDENYEYEAEQVDPNTYTGAQKAPVHQDWAGHSQARAQDYPEGNLNYTTRKPVPPSASEELDDSTTPRNLPTEVYPSGPSADMPQIQQPVSPPAQGLGPPPSRSNTTRSTKNARKDWASDRSPLQKLEVTLTGISKEEKRARVQEAEIKARERIARQKAEKEKAELMAAVAREASAQGPQPETKPVPGPGRREERRDIPIEEPMRNESAATAAPLAQRQPGSTAVRHSRTVSSTPQYAEIRRPEDPQYSRAEAAIPALTKMGHAPRRSVTVSRPAAKPAPANSIGPQPLDVPSRSSANATYFKSRKNGRASHSTRNASGERRVTDQAEEGICVL